MDTAQIARVYELLESLYRPVYGYSRHVLNHFRQALTELRARQIRDDAGDEFF